MEKTASILLSALLALTVLGVASPSASASHESSAFVVSGSFSANTEHWISLLTPDSSGCLGGTIDYPANELFFVSHGWGFFIGNSALPEEMPALMGEATTFALLIDGQIQSQSRVYQPNYFGVPDLMAKLLNTEYHNGLTGSHLFTGQFYLDASLFGGSFGDPLLIFECNTTVNFTA